VSICRKKSTQKITSRGAFSVQAVRKGEILGGGGMLSGGLASESRREALKIAGPHVQKIS